ncbi:MAG TPA: GNAT family N-acetyltransferase [Firmicutes bacterium]|nr:GNAT family N-acetyltransferase [Bacillota bacterium]
MIAGLAVLLWKEHTIQELKDEFLEIILQEKAQFFLKYDQNVPVGFAQCQLRYDYVEGTETSPVGYLEGIFVQEEYRHKGYARELLSACEQWARNKGCQEFASDCEIGNDSSIHFHTAAGFTEANRIVCFTKKL